MYKNLIFQNCVKRDDIVFVKLSMYRCALILKTDSMESAKLLTARALSAPMEGDESGKYWEDFVRFSRICSRTCVLSLGQSLKISTTVIRRR